MSRFLDPFRFVLVAVAGWMNQRQLQIIDYLREENRVLREQLGGQRSSLSAKAKGLGRRLLPKSPPSSRQRPCWLGIGNSLRKTMTAARSADRGDLALPKRSRLWWSDWQQRT